MPPHCGATWLDFPTALNRAKNSMPAYVIVEIEVQEPVRYETYKQMVPQSLHAYAGRFLVRGGKAENPEGNWRPKRLGYAGVSLFRESESMVDLTGICSGEGHSAGNRAHADDCRRRSLVPAPQP